jgi:hypothetical protein
LKANHMKPKVFKIGATKFLSEREVGGMKFYVTVSVQTAKTYEVEADSAEAASEAVFEDSESPATLIDEMEVWSQVEEVTQCGSEEVGA